ncbi:metallophosphoesterase family protein [Gangjinia marincola]|uniref:Metallophosphoesterase family protein n=1 Tax=Gangjinia marincola TaxID=578463 RepID=A0ABP3XYM8_9FLAO
MRTLVIGDIHGGLIALKQVLERAQVTAEDRLIFLGDYVDGWSDSAATVSFLIKLQSTHECVFIRGNHDQLVQDYLEKNIKSPKWLEHGGALTVENYAKLSAEEIAQHLNFYQRLTSFHVDDKNRLFCHAGFTNLHGPSYEYFPRMLWWDRTLWETALALNPALTPEDERYPERFKLFDEIYIGHTPLYRIGATVPCQAANVWNMDTSAAYKGALSIMDVDSKQVWQSDPVYTLYPTENGRN